MRTNAAHAPFSIALVMSLTRRWYSSDASRTCAGNVGADAAVQSLTRSKVSTPKAPPPSPPGAFVSGGHHPRAPRRRHDSTWPQESYVVARSSVSRNP